MCHRLFLHPKEEWTLNRISGLNSLKHLLSDETILSLDSPSLSTDQEWPGVTSFVVEGTAKGLLDRRLTSRCELGREGWGKLNSGEEVPKPSKANEEK